MSTGARECDHLGPQAPTPSCAHKSSLLSTGTCKINKFDDGVRRQTILKSTIVSTGARECHHLGPLVTTPCCTRQSSFLSTGTSKINPFDFEVRRPTKLRNTNLTTSAKECHHLGPLVTIQCCTRQSSLLSTGTSKINKFDFVVRRPTKFRNTNVSTGAKECHHLGPLSPRPCCTHGSSLLSTNTIKTNSADSGASQKIRPLKLNFPDRRQAM